MVVLLFQDVDFDKSEGHQTEETPVYCRVSRKYFPPVFEEGRGFDSSASIQTSQIAIRPPNIGKMMRKFLFRAQTDSGHA